jgi:hypothetical protein
VPRSIGEAARRYRDAGGRRYRGTAARAASPCRRACCGNGVPGQPWLDCPFHGTSSCDGLQRCGYIANYCLRRGVGTALQVVMLSWRA